MGGSTFVYEFSGNDNIGEMLYWFGGDSFEPAAVAEFVRYLSKARTVLDIGANTGVYTLLALAGNPACRVVSWEPYSGNYQKLRRNVLLNGFDGRAELRCEAASSQSGSVFLRPHENWTMHSVADTSMAGTAISATTVDSVIADGEPVDLIKIDVEEFEYEVLCGSLRVLRESRPVLVLEIQPHCATKERTLALLREIGYSVRSIDAQANWLALPHSR